MALRRYLSIFAEKRPNCQVKLHIVRNEVRQSPVMLESSANCPAAVSSALQDYLDIIWPNSSVMREGLLKVKKDFECLLCRLERWTCLRAERGWELLMVCGHTLTVGTGYPAPIIATFDFPHKKKMNFSVSFYADLSLLSAL